MLGTGIASLQTLIVLVLSIGAFGMELFALVDASRHSAGSYVSAGKRTKQFWLILLGVAAALGFLALPLGVSPLSSFGILSLVAVVASGVYLADVRPAVRQSRGRREGPYGPW